MPEVLKVVDADTLLSTPLKKSNFIVDGFLPQGVSIISGAPKVGKSWLMLWLSLNVAQGNPVWEMETRKSEVLYLCLEDTLQRIQSRLYQLTENAPDNLYFAVMSEQIGTGLLQQLEGHIAEHPDTGLIIIDTLQKVRTPEKEKSGIYATDYNEISALKVIADKYGIGIVLVHHLRKQKDAGDPLNQISGSTGITGAVDSAYVITKSNRTDTTANLVASGRDIEQQQFVLRFEDCEWKVVEHKGKEELQKEEIPPLLFQIVSFIKDQNHWEGTATQLLEQLEDSETSPIIVSRLLSRFYYEVLEPEGIEYKTKRTGQNRLIYLTASDRCDENDENSNM